MGAAHTGPRLALARLHRAGNNTSESEFPTPSPSHVQRLRRDVAGHHGHYQALHRPAKPQARRAASKPLKRGVK